MYTAPMLQFPRPGRMLRILLIANAAAYVVQLVGFAAMGSDAFLGIFALTRSGLGRGMVWQLVTYSLLHGNLMHLLFNMLGLYFFGTELERLLGERLFLKLYLFCTIVAGLGWVLLSGGSGAACIGASGAVMGVVGMFAAIYPQRRITLLLMLVFPVTLTARTLGLGYIVISFLMMLGDSGSVAHAAHLFGGIAGYALGVLAVRQGGPKSFASRGGRAARRRRSFTVIEGEAIDHDEEPVSRADVDRILEKIKREGIRALTREERRILDQASKGFSG
jgi:membrane associated rhomboid family serine protease